MRRSLPPLILAVALPASSPSAASCLPADVPPLESLALVDVRIIQLEGGRPTEHYMMIGRLYRAPDGQELSILWLDRTVAAIVDDTPRDPVKADWWLDPAIASDDVPPRIIGHEPSCQWRRRQSSA